VRCPTQTTGPGVASQLISRVTEPQAQYAATDLASLNSLQAALASSTPAARVAAEFQDGRVVGIAGVDVIVLDSAGAVLYTTECDVTGGSTGVVHPSTAQCEGSNPHVSAALPSVRAVLGLLGSAACAPAAVHTAACPQTAAGVENLSASVPAFDVAVPVWSGPPGTRRPLGVVVYSSPLQNLFANYGPVIGYTPLYLTTAGTPALLRFLGSGYTPSSATAPAEILAAASAHRTTSGGDAFVAHGVYPAPAGGDVAGSFVPMQAPGTSQVSGYLGVEIPLSLFAARASQDEQTIAQISLTALLVLCVLVLVFVDRFVRRPVRRLERGVARIASGDYATDIPVRSRDELGRLATSVNRMREQISGYIRHIDGSMERLQRVSRALTTTTGGVERLQEAVLDSAASLLGPGASATLLSRASMGLTPARSFGDTAFLGRTAVAPLLGGEHVRSQSDDVHVLAVPMFYQERVTGALAVCCPQAISDSDERALVTLANNAAVALENTSLFEQQKQTLERLRELNNLKSDFLATTQHELRTPVLAIQGQLELLSAAWGRWDEASKLDVLRDIDISTKLLGELVNTIVDFSLLNAETIDLQIGSVDVRSTVDRAVADVAGHFKNTLPVELFLDVARGVSVRADAARFRQVIRSLLDNAVKFTPPGGHVLVSARVERAADRCRIEVADSGIGIAADALPLVFDRFFQEDNTRTRRYGGMGMGLALARRLCDAHGATVSVESAPGQGSRFTVLWPLAGPVTAATEREATQRTAV